MITAQFHRMNFDGLCARHRMAFRKAWRRKIRTAAVPTTPSSSHICKIPFSALATAEWPGVNSTFADSPFKPSQKVFPDTRSQALAASIAQGKAAWNIPVRPVISVGLPRARLQCHRQSLWQFRRPRVWRPRLSRALRPVPSFRSEYTDSRKENSTAIERVRSTLFAIATSR